MDASENLLTRRFERLDRENLVFKRLVVVALLVVAGATAGWANFDGPPIRRAAMNFSLRNKAGERLAGLDVGPGCAALNFNAKDGNVRGGLGTTDEGLAYLSMRDKGSVLVLEADIDMNGLPSLYSYGKKDFRRFLLAENEEGQVALFFDDEVGADRCALLVGGGGSPSLCFFDPDFKRRGDIFVTPEGETLLNFTDQAENQRVELELREDGPSLDLLDMNRFRLFFVPQP